MSASASPPTTSSRSSYTNSTLSHEAPLENDVLTCNSLATSLLFIKGVADKDPVVDFRMLRWCRVHRHTLASTTASDSKCRNRSQIPPDGPNFAFLPLALDSSNQVQAPVCLQGKLTQQQLDRLVSELRQARKSTKRVSKSWPLQLGCILFGPGLLCALKCAGQNRQLTEEQNLAVAVASACVRCNRELASRGIVVQYIDHRGVSGVVIEILPKLSQEVYGWDATTDLTKALTQVPCGSLPPVPNTLYWTGYQPQISQVEYEAIAFEHKIAAGFCVEHDEAYNMTMIQAYKVMRQGILQAVSEHRNSLSVKKEGDVCSKERDTGKGGESPVLSFAESLTQGVGTPAMEGVDSPPVYNHLDDFSI
ncbi:hypothetical protein CYMTET_13553 [Cymbomonas tetramitiformis]|uniref:Uncharacterized protein n=1 Tax=Cymbomonas tetramitiformis TaxID=36881 RepID=A0AAE0GHW2_9CHLO|nr:hypothetical protein CYMTET_13553 [Cymbomonas tetramitiformis]